MTPHALPILVLLALPPFALAADPPAARTPQRAFTAALEQGGHAVAAALGRHGAWVVTSQARWDEVLKALARLGVPVDDQLGAIDFAKENLACIFHYGDEGDQFALHKADPTEAKAGEPAGVDARFVMSYVIYKQRRALPMGVWKLLAAPIPNAARTRVSVATFHPLNGGPNPTADRASLEWAWTFGDATGEAVGHLTGTIDPERATVQAGQDIRLKFTLAYAQPDQGESRQFAREIERVVHVWDGKYSAGYRNHAFEVVTPDGQTHLLRPNEIRGWDKNIPHPVAIKPGQPYVLPNWAEGDALKSLQGLGLDTSKPGAYRVTGVYQEVGAPNGENPEMWGGVVRTNTVTVQVK